ncbi:MAG TPA: ABC transporter permease [Peptostreptococcaceae bacterium]|nr:ABC transporter permease [Peptostreptococcaceae bacterium]
MDLVSNKFELVGVDKELSNKSIHKTKDNNYIYNKIKSTPYISISILSIILLGCLFAPFVTNNDPTYMNLGSQYQHPNNQYIFGTDSMGRDIYSRIWHGGRVSILIGLLSSFISTFIGIIYGSISGYVEKSIGGIMMRFIDIMLSIPSILIMILIQSISGGDSYLSIAFVIAITSWMTIAKVVRSEVMELKHREFVYAAKIMGASFRHILIKHLIPNFLPAIIYMSVMNIISAIIMESTLSFLGMGIPIELASWGSMLSQGQDAILGNRWWIILIPGLFIMITLICINNIAEYMRKVNNKKLNNL